MTPAMITALKPPQEQAPDPEHPVVAWIAVAAIVALAVLSTALAYLIFFRILRRAGATNLSLVTLLIPASAILLGALVLNEQVAPHHLAGMGLIALGLVAIDGRLWRAMRG